MFGVSRFKDRIAVISGGEHPLGGSLARRLASFGATVVVVGRDDQRLRDLARHAPDRIEPLALRPGRRDVLMLLREAWGDQPLDLYVDLTGLCPFGDQGAGEGLEFGFGLSAGIGAALVEGIRTGRADCVMAVPSTARGTPDTVETQARAAGFGALVRLFAGDVLPGRFLGLGLPAGRHDWTEACLLSAGDMVLMMCHPVSRGLVTGSVLEWSPPDPNDLSGAGSVSGAVPRTGEGGRATG